MTKTNFLGYAYPSSIIATFLGRGKIGCYYLAVTKDGMHGENDVIYAAENKQDVIGMAKHVMPANIPWDKYSMYQEEQSC